jgi:N-acyl-D-aspartate/D-glutamate deacylase/Leucine-rich repeat (LRR) protein
MKWLSFLVLACTAWSQQYDLVVKGGKLVDGSGNPWRRADVGVRAGKIAAVGDLKAAQAARVIDATGMIVAPGFIDIHNHSDDTILVDGNAESMVRQGVTSMIFGEGGSAAPDKTYPDFDAYFAAVKKNGVSTNIGTYVGSSQVWTWVRGPKAGPPTADELKRMQDVVRDAMKQGALGVASSLSGPPGSWIDTDTLVAMASVAGEYGGIYSTHMRTEGNGVFQSVAEALDIGRRAKVPVDIIHIKIAEHKMWGKMPELIGLIKQARDNGQQVEANVYPYRAGQNNLSSIIPPWAHEGGRDAMLARLKDPTEKVKIREQVLNGIPDQPTWYNHYTATGSWEGMLLVSLSNPEYKKFEGKRMNEVIASLGGDPVEALFKVLLDNRGSIPTVYFHHNEDDMRYALKQPFVSIGSDGTAVKTEGPLARGNPHPRYYGTFPRVLGRYVRDEPVLSMEEAIRKMTSANASKLGLYDRGLIRTGMWADITVFDPKTVIDNSIWDKPHQYATGIDHVIVNGQVVLAKGQHTNARAGAILYGSGKQGLVTATSDRKTAEWVLRAGGNVRVLGKTDRIYNLADLPDGDFRLSAVDLVGTMIDPKELSKLSGLDELTELFLPGPIFNPGAGSTLDANAELKPLASLRKLEKLHFSLHFLTNVNVQDKGLEHLKDLTGIKELRLTQTKVNGSSLSAFTNLQKLDLNYSTFNDGGMKHLAGMKNLTDLALRDTLVTDAGLAHIAGLSNLVNLDLYGTRITDAGVKHLAGLKKLQRLNLLGATISDDAVAVLAGLRDLKELNLYRSQITNVGMAKLQALKNLQSLDVRYTRVSRGGIDEFRRAVPGAVIEFQEASPQTASAAIRQSKPAAATEQAIIEWVTKLGGKATATEVNLSRTPITDTQVQFLAGLKSLEALSLETTEVGDLGVAALKNLPSLKRLNLSHTMLSSRGLASLPPSVTHLTVANSLVDVLEGIDRLAKLESLSLAGCGVHDDDAAKLAALPALRELDLSYTEITDAGVKRLPAVESLDLNATEIGDAGLEAIAAMMPNLKHLRVNYGRFTDQGVKALGSLRNLESLEVARSRMTDESMEAIAALPKLRGLNLDYTSVSDIGLAVLAKAQPQLEWLRLDTANITDAAVDSLASLKTLKDLNLYHTLVTEKAFDALKLALPECRIVFDVDSSVPTRRKS